MPQTEQDAKLRAWWAHRQGLSGPAAGDSAGSILRETGWARSVGGSSPYLTLWARGGLRRGVVDAAVAQLEICELPSARGCTYVVPAQHFELALTLGVVSSEAERKVAAKLGVTVAEIDRLALAVKDALADGPLSPDELRGRVGNAARNLGPEGVKKGITTTLPLALGMLQVSGDIRRVPVNGRLDQQRYRYTLWEPNPIRSKMPLEEAYTELARLYFRWIGPAALAEFQWFSGLGAKAAKAAMAPLDLVEITEGRSMHAADADAFRAFAVPDDPSYRLISSLDGLSLLRRDVKGLLAPGDFDRPLDDEKGRKVAAGSLSDLPSHAIVDRGRIAGLWEFDPEKAEVVYCSFDGPNSELDRAVRETEAFLREDLGDARAFSLDSPKSRAPRIEFLRKAGKS